MSDLYTLPDDDCLLSKHVVLNKKYTIKIFLNASLCYGLSHDVEVHARDMQSHEK
jgi:hypothetical protein